MLEIYRQSHECPGAITLDMLVEQLGSHATSPAFDFEAFNSREQNIFDTFLRATENRPVAATSIHPVVPRTKRWIQRIMTLTPVTIYGDEATELRAIPYRESPVIDSFSPEYCFSEDTLPHAYGYFITKLTPKKVLDHALVSRPWLVVSTQKINRLKRLNPSLDSHLWKKDDRAVAKQIVFQRLMQEIIELENF